MTDKPTPPDDLPAYTTDPIARQDPPRLRRIRTYVDDLLAYHEDKAEQALDEDDLAGDDEEVVDVEEDSGGTIVTKKVPCGKASCSTCPHGPYDYRVQRVGDSIEWTYLGPSSE